MNIVFSGFRNKKSSPTPTKGVKDLAEGPTCSVSISSGCFLSSLFMKILIKTISKYFIKNFNGCPQLERSASPLCFSCRHLENDF